MSELLALLDMLERVAPRLEFYPRGAKILFAVTFVICALGILVFVTLYPAARRRAAHDEPGG